MVVEEDATWPGNQPPARVATVFRVADGKVTAPLRLLDQAHAWQERVFDELTAGWSRKRRSDFRRAMADPIARSYTIGE